MVWSSSAPFHFNSLFILWLILRKTTLQFVEEAQRVHGEKFDYSEVEYVNTHTPVKIKCRQCGVVFMQEPASHLAGSGCSK